jgi:predicted negative regulator of RcsB-dependent stress response
LADSERSLGRAVEAAWAAHDDEALAWAWKDLAWSVGVWQARPAEALQVLHSAELASRSLRGEVATNVRMSILGARGSILDTQGDHVGAAEAYSEALELARAEQWKGNTSRIRGQLGDALAGQRRTTEALVELRKALAEAEATLGEQDVRVAYLHIASPRSGRGSRAARSALDRAEALFTHDRWQRASQIAASRTARWIASSSATSTAAYAALAAREIRLPRCRPNTRARRASYNLAPPAHRSRRFDERGRWRTRRSPRIERSHGGDPRTSPDADGLLGSSRPTHGDRTTGCACIGRAVEIADRTLPASTTDGSPPHPLCDVLIAAHRPAEGRSPTSTAQLARDREGEVDEVLASS